MIYTLHQEADFLSGFGQKNILPAAHFLTEVWYAVQSFTKNPACGAFFFIKKSCPWAIWFQCVVWFTNSSVLTMIRIPILSDHNDTICKKINKESVK